MWTPIQTAQNKTGSGTSAALSFANPVGNGNVVCGYFFYTTSTTNVVTLIQDDQVNRYDPVIDILGTGLQFGTFWGGPFSNAPKTITINVSVSQANLWLGLDEFSPGGTIIALDGHNIGQGSPVSSSGNFATAQNGDLVYSAVVDATTPAVGAGFTGLQALSNFNSEYLVQGTAGVTAGTWTTTGVNGVAGAFALNASSPAGVLVLGMGRLVFV